MKILHINKKFNTRGYRNRNIDIHSESSLKVTEVKGYNYFNMVEISLSNICSSMWGNGPKTRKEVGARVTQYHIIHHFQPQWNEARNQSIRKLKTQTKCHTIK